MNNGKKTRYFTRDRCRQRKKRIAIGIALLLSIGLCGALFYMIVFADNYNSSGYATIKVVSPTGYSSTMKVTYKFAGPSDALKGNGNYREKFKEQSRPVYISAAEYSGDLLLGIEGDNRHDTTQKKWTSLDSEKRYCIISFNISYKQPAHDVYNNQTTSDVGPGRYHITNATNATHQTSDHWVTIPVEINLSNTHMITDEQGKWHHSTLTINLRRNNYTLTYNINGGTVTNYNEGSRNSAGNVVYTRADNGGVGRAPTVTKKGYYNDYWYYGSNTNNRLNLPITLCNENQSVTAHWAAYSHNIMYNLNGGKYGNNNQTELNGCKIVPNGIYHMKSVCGTNMYMHVKDCYPERRSDPVVTWNNTGDSRNQADWIFERYGSTQYYYIISRYNGLALALDGAPSSDQSSKELELWNQEEGVDDYLWYIKTNSDGTLTIYNKSTNNCIDVYNAGTANGTKVQQWRPNTSNAQKWTLETVSQKDYPDRMQFGDHNFAINSVEPVSENHSFAGWNTRADGKGKFYFPGDTYSDVNTGTTVTLYAIWDIDNYIISYDSNGGVGTMASQEVKGNTTVTLAKNVFTRAGYLFTGWSLEKYAKQPTYADGTSYPNRLPEVTLYAQWQKIGTGFIQRPFSDLKMFYKTVSITGQNGTTYNREKIDSRMAHIDVSDNPGYFSLKK